MKSGYFDDQHKEYVITTPKTPLPWINYLGSNDFFSLISNTCGGYSFYKDAKLLRITRYRYNNIPADSNGKYYYIGNDGIMKTGWQQIDGQWYYMDQTGVMQTGWFKSEDGKWYFLYPNGAMAVNTVIDGRTIGEDGVWVPNEGDTEPRYLRSVRSLRRCRSQPERYHEQGIESQS